MPRALTPYRSNQVTDSAISWSFSAVDSGRMNVSVATTRCSTNVACAQ